MLRSIAFALQEERDAGRLRVPRDEEGEQGRRVEGRGAQRSGVRIVSPPRAPEHRGGPDHLAARERRSVGDRIATARREVAYRAPGLTALQQPRLFRERVESDHTE